VTFMRWRIPTLALALLAAGAGYAADAPNLADQYRPVAGKLIDAALADTEATTGWPTCAIASATA